MSRVSLAANNSGLGLRLATVAFLVDGLNFYSFSTQLTSASRLEPDAQQSILTQHTF